MGEFPLLTTAQSLTWWLVFNHVGRGTNTQCYSTSSGFVVIFLPQNQLIVDELQEAVTLFARSYTQKVQVLWEQHKSMTK